ncbi:MAG TPA: 23S rRNA (adenine(2503)-C(2))-methyltransferase RlmN [Terracidiphilus sp.]|nr:23S rRNA (adenine(2503)-C(2))-methyltransferase RlmN [Terracidiphilus sp.]
MLGPAVTAHSSQLVRLDTNKASEGSLREIFGVSGTELSGLASSLGEPEWRGRQIAEAIYSQRVTEISEITTLPKTLRVKLAQSWVVGRPRIVQTFISEDGTERYLVEGQSTAEESAQAAPPGTVETVWMPDGDGGEAGDGSDADRVAPQLLTRKNWDRATICVSSQMGCAVNCQFCLTAKLGLQRNLTRGEIAGQVVAVMDRHGVEVGKDRLNLVFMGMGEPLLNYDNWMGAVRLLVEEVGISPLRMTVSTSGIVPGIERLAAEPPEMRPKLAISLNAPNDAIRSDVMPVNRKWPIDAMLAAVREVKLRAKERITFEYVLLGGVTDRPEHAREVAKLVRRAGFPVKVNLIAWNPGPGIPYEMPHAGAVELFQQTLLAEGVPVYLRRPRGRDIFAACGQLKRTEQQGTRDQG